jgi:hypothetical protein
MVPLVGQARISIRAGSYEIEPGTTPRQLLEKHGARRTDDGAVR